MNSELNPNLKAQKRGGPVCLDSQTQFYKRMRFALYIMVGVISWVVDVAIYHLSWSLIGIVAGQFLARIAGAATAFLLNRRMTFRTNKDVSGVGLQAVKYTTLLVLNWAVTVGLIYGLIYSLSMHPLTAKILLDIVIVPGNYLVMKYWVFPHSSTRSRSE